MSDLQQGCSPSECGTKPACAGCSHNHNQAAETAKKEPPKVRKVIGVVSGKGGVGKSLVSGELAVMLSRMGYRVGVLDADITGPSIPRMFGIHDKALGDGEHIFPAETEKGIEVMSINLMLENDDAPVIWRGPVIAGAVKQFWEDVAWGELDVMVIDMPPGTGDVPLTVFQSIPRGRRLHPAGSGRHDRPQGRQHGQYDEHPRARSGGEHVLRALPGLRQAHRAVR